jgi:hypothetical protein
MLAAIPDSCATQWLLENQANLSFVQKNSISKLFQLKNTSPIPTNHFVNSKYPKNNPKI